MREKVTVEIQNYNMGFLGKIELILLLLAIAKEYDDDLNLASRMMHSQLELWLSSNCQATLETLLL